MTIYAIGDIHGQLAMLEDALERIERDGGSNACVILLGDLVDRGPDVRGVLELISNGVVSGKNWIVLRGNHDRLFQNFMGPVPRVSDVRLLVGYDWFHKNMGGIETLASYDVEVSERRRLYEIHDEATKAVPQSHIDLLNGMRDYHLEDGKLFVHAGVAPGVPLEEQTQDDLVWIREPFLSDPVAHPWLVVHGHTPVKQATHFGNRVALDSGAAYGYPLSVGVFEGSEVMLLGPNGREPIHRK